MKKIFKVLVPVLAGGALLLGTATSAVAETKVDEPGMYYVTQDTATGDCMAELFHGSGDFVRGTFYNDDSSYTCEGWLERSTNDGASWSLLSDYHTLASGAADQNTDDYYDGPGYWAKACFKFTSWAGAATHCTDAYTVS